MTSTAHDPQYIGFIASLRNARKTKGLSQAELASILNKPQSFVSKVETCERRLDLIEAIEWCIALGLYLEDIVPPELSHVLRCSPSSRDRQKGRARD